MFFEPNPQRLLAWPPLPGLLDLNLLFIFSKPREQWEKSEWQLYALFLENRGEKQNLMLIDYICQLVEEKAKHSRSKGSKKKRKIVGLLSILDEPKTKRGPKPKLERVAIYDKAIEVQENKLNITNKEALTTVLVESGKASWRANQEIKSQRLEKGLSEYKLRKKIRN